MGKLDRGTQGGGAGPKFGEDAVRRHGAVGIPAVVAALPHCGESRPCPDAQARQQQRKAFLYAPRFSPAASD